MIQNKPQGITARSFRAVSGAISMVLISLFFLFSFNESRGESERESLAKDHPRPSYDDVKDIEAMARALRESKPAIQRGAWEWDRLLSRYLDGGRKEKNVIVILQAYFRSILDREGKGDRYKSFFYGHGAWGSGGRLRIYQELVRQKMLTAEEQALFREIISESLKSSFDYSMSERSANNRPYGVNGGTAIALQMFPDLPQAKSHRRWLDAQWLELAEYGDTTETNYYPYGPIYLDGLLDMAEGMGKFETERQFLHAHVSRYLDYVHGGGVRGNPNSGSLVDLDRTRAYADPWNSEYYKGARNDAHVWYRLAKEYRSPEFLWASEQASLGGRPPEGREVPAGYQAALKRRYQWFLDQGIEPSVPAGGAKIGYYSPQKHKVPERLYLCPNRKSGKPFASFYLYDRNNNYMHYNDDVMGQIYEYCVDGAKFLHTSGKYNSNAMKLPASYDAFWVQHPSLEFVTGRVGAIPYGTWKAASMPLPGLLNSRRAPSSERWKYNAEIDLFRRKDDPDFGYAHGNMDGYWYLNNEFHLKSFEFELAESVVEMRIPRLSGPKGDRLLFDGWDKIPSEFKVLEKKGEEVTRLIWKGNDPWNKYVTLAQGPKEESDRVLRIWQGTEENPEKADDTRFVVQLDEIDFTFDASKGYTRLHFEHNGRIRSGRGGFGTRGAHEAGFSLNGRMEYLTYDARGGILERDSLRAENRGEDSYGQFRYRNYFGPRSSWTRQTVLTQEGYLIVRDSYLPCESMNGYEAGPCWLLRPELDWKNDDQPDRGPIGHDPDRNWFHAPAWDHAWWQKEKKRLLVWIHPGEGKTFGVTAHDTTPDISRMMGSNYYPTQNSHGKAILKAGETEVFLSVLVPFTEGEKADPIAEKIETWVTNENCRATIGKVAVSIGLQGEWKVSR